MSSTGARTRSLRRSMGDVAPFGSPSKPSYAMNHSMSQPPSARGSPIGFGSRGLMSPTSRHRSGVGMSGNVPVGGRLPYGVSRSHNNSPLTLPAEHLPQSLSTSSAYGHGFPAYYDDPESPGMMDGMMGGGRAMHRGMAGSRRAPLRSYHSIEREPGYRDRSFDRMAGVDTVRSMRQRDRSLDRALYPRDDLSAPYGRDTLLDDPMGYGRDTMMNPTAGRSGGLMHGGVGPTGIGQSGMPYGQAGTGLPPTSGRLSATNDQFIMELQARLNDLQIQYNHVKRELEATTQKLASCMHSIKTFWSPELKKERALRKEEAAKYALINDQLKILRSENQKQAALIRQLEEELRMANMRNPDHDVQQHLDALYMEKEHMSKEIYLLRETNKVNPISFSQFFFEKKI
ncbi:hypothetical protein BLA29_005767 [Euroglyphus maynei]|uniref:ELKS/Rab6-interacting/CAST family member 1-like protein n=1 Tax=Euroglyphus maynei TaxID=6958 RepID=A0A1Y3AYP6_EURMA|nr:hypothetical protein BLA29_005767 [Euroglyphus maynei]